MKKSLSILIITVMLVSMVPMNLFTASAATNNIYDLWTYEIVNNEVTITDCDTAATGELVIPETIEDLSVTSIGDSAFSGCESLTSITIPDTVTSIGDYAFEDCSSLTSITVPDAVTSIGDWSFSRCSKLTAVTLPDSVISVGYGAFNCCDNLVKINYTGDINEWCCIEFSDNPLLCNYTGILYLNGEQLTGDIILSNDVTKIPCGTFKHQQITGIVIPDSVTSIGSSAFCGCENLASITIPNGVASIGSSAFYGCENLISITIPDSIVSIDYNAFGCCYNLEKVYYTGDINKWCNIDFDNDNSSSPLYYGNLYINSELLTGDIILSNNITKIPYGTFKNQQITSIIIPESITSIGYGAFFGCSSLTSITIPDSVSSIGIRAFQNCSSLTSVTIPNSVTSIEAFAFYGCSSLTSIKIPDSVTSIGDDTFAFCENLTSITIPNSVTSIGDYIFYYCQNLVSVTMPNGITSIGYDAFRGCSSLASITIPDSVTSISDCAFFDCESLTSVNIPEGVASIGDSAFRGCSGLQDGDGFVILKNILFDYFGNDANVNIPQGVTSIGDCAFYCCYNIKSITIPDSVTLIGNSAFSHCENLISITLPDSVALIDDYAFSCCYHLESIIIPDSVTSVGFEAFYGCGLKKVALSNKMTTIEKNVFERTNIKVVYIPKEILLIETGAFNDTEIKYVYYGGTEQDKQNLTILANNDSLDNAIWVYNSTELPDCEYDNTCDDECNRCTLTRVITHKYQSYYNADNHYDECTICSDIINDGSHKYDNACDTTCDYCEYTRETTHSYKQTYDNENHFNSCSICGDVINIESHEYDSDCDNICNICEKIRIAPNHIDSHICNNDDCDYVRVVTAEELQAVLNALPETMKLDIPETEYGKAAEIVASKIKDILIEQGYEYEENYNNIYLNAITQTGYGIEIEIQDVRPYTSTSIHSIIIDISRYKNDSSYSSSDDPYDIGKSIYLAYSSSDQYSQEDADYVKSLTLQVPNCYEVDIESLIDRTISIDDAASEYYTALLNDDSLFIDAKDYAGGRNGLNIYTHGGMWVAIFKDQILYNVIWVENRNTVPVINIPYEISNEDAYDYVVGKITEYDENFGENITGIERIKTLYGEKTDDAYIVYSTYKVESCDYGYVIIRKSSQCSVCSYDNTCDNICNVCGTTRTVGDHSYTNNCDTNCDICDATRNITHTYTNSCDTACNVCGTARTITHSYGAYIYNNDSTYEKDGTKTRTCSVCGDKQTITAEGTKLEKKLVDSSAMFTDVKADSWYKPYIDYAATYGLLNGTGSGKMAPERTITRAEFVQVLANLAGVNTSNKSVSTSFTDIKSDQWYTSAVKWANENGIVYGTSATDFSPNEQITREQMCTMLIRYIENYLHITLENKDTKKNFVDDDQISSWAKDSVYKCQMGGLVSGVSATEFAPKDSANRASVATIMSRFHEQYLK